MSRGRARGLYVRSPDGSQEIVERRPPQMLTDGDVIQYYYRELHDQEVRVITTDKFLKKTKDHYGPHFLSREIVQNFVDHGQTGHLNDVEFIFTDLPADGLRVEIIGDWSFSDKTGVISAHSDKTTETETAGGNGIGLKQAAIRFMRDFGVKKFEINGDGWTVNYLMTQAEQINRELAQKAEEQGACPIVSVKHNWLAADIVETESRNKCSYVFETDDEKLIRELKRMPELGVSDNNPHLQDPNFQNEHGIIKWLPKSEEEGDVKGRLFVNGQVMGFKKKGETPDTYWQGPEYVSLALHDIQYEMNIDRPPVSEHYLGDYSSKLLESMSQTDLMGQLEQSEYLWSSFIELKGDENRFEKKGYLIILEKIIDQLCGPVFWSSWASDKEKKNKRVFKEKFGDKQYVCADVELGKKQLQELQEKGFVICPGFFERIGMEKASDQLSADDEAFGERPDSYGARRARERAAEQAGLQVFYEEFPEEKLDNLESFFDFVIERLKEYGFSVTKLGESSEKGTVILRLNIDSSIDKRLLSQSQPSLKSDDLGQKLLHFLRGVVFHGKVGRFFSDIAMSQGDYVTNFILDNDDVSRDKILIARNVENTNGEGLFLRVELKPDVAQVFGDISSGNNRKAQSRKNVERPESSQTDIPPDVDRQKSGSPLSTLKKSRLGRELLAVLTALGVITGAGSYLYKHADSVGLNESDTDEQRGGRRSLRDSSKPVDEQERKSFLKRILHSLTTYDFGDRESQTGGASNKYSDWLRSKGYYGDVARGRTTAYAGNNTLRGILSEYGVNIDNGRSINRRQRGVDRTGIELRDLVNKMYPETSLSEDFEIIHKPTTLQLEKLELLRIYSDLLIGQGEVSNKFFIYKGGEAYGVNIGGKAIGIHQDVLDQDITRVVSTFFHEIAHNMSMRHDPRFMNAMQALFSADRDMLTNISIALSANMELSEREKAFLSLNFRWGEITEAESGRRERNKKKRERRRVRGK